jgi:hypothetical protein
MSVDEIRAPAAHPAKPAGVPQPTERALDLAGWDERRDARAIQLGKRETEQEQRSTFEDARRAPAAPEPAAATVPQRR